MPTVDRSARALSLLLCACVSAAGCGSSDRYKDGLLGADWMPSTAEPDASAPPAPDGGGEDPPPPGLAKCAPASTSEPLPAREAAMESERATARAPHGVFTADLFGQFVDHCGSCHANLAAQGGLSVNITTFPARIGAEALERLTSDDPELFMPPPPLGKPFSSRGENDPLRAFASSLEQWIDAGRPADVFYPTVEPGGDGGASPFILSKSVGMQMTNLGNCVPEAAMVGIEPGRAEELDALFEAMDGFEDLPKRLEETDLFTLDAEELAKHGVVAFAPAYTLWADHAKKIRMVRVPKGESIHFDASTQQLEIPANTRFYKTFLKKVIDYYGNERYRKIETRIIVSRPDEGDRHTALFGTYKWNEEETEAVLQEVPYRDGTGFTDDVFTYVTDERIEDEVLRAAPLDLAAALKEAGATRTYAIPGSERCIHCHMGAPDASFILGFTPVQLHRRPEGEGGVFEAPRGDELSQVRRLIEYGVITGLRSADEIVVLEDSQGDRKPRNEHELTAQAYMLGNCAHCHNPRGFPSRREQALADVLDFMPSATGGVFQFPIDKVSPRTFRGESQRIPIPYVHPSLYDIPKNALYTRPNVSDDEYSEKWILRAGEHDTEDAVLARWQQVINTYRPEGYEGYERFQGFDLPNEAGRPLLAPWRSLIYRNVDGPFSYQDGSTIFPHMPMDTPGYDCRARRLLGEWMASIPARWKNAPPEKRVLLRYLEMAEPEPVPYEEVPPGDPGYEAAVAQAALRLEEFRESPRYTRCPPEELDILAPDVVSGVRSAPFGDQQSLYDESGELREIVVLYNIPARPHYFKTDLKDDPSWGIRRPDWYEILVEGAPDITKPASKPTVVAESRDALAVLSDKVLDDGLTAMALTPVPFGLWVSKDACAAKFERAGIRAVSAFAGADRPSWMTYASAPSDARVYEISPGAQVFNAVCSKCHGPEANGQSALANTIADLSGGLSRVANLRDGLFGPPEDPGASRHQPDKFGLAAGALGLTVDQWAARYLAWMGLSGTNATIPSAAIAQIGAAEVLGRGREANLMGVQDEDAAANMLSAVKAACQALIPFTPQLPSVRFDIQKGQVVEAPDASDLAEQRKQTLQGIGFILDNGDKDLWERLCLWQNPAPVRVVRFINNRFMVRTARFQEEHYQHLIARDAYPAGAEVGHGAAIAAGVHADNAYPWCVAPYMFEGAEAAAGRALPRCPPELFEPANMVNVKREHAPTNQELNRWAMQGAATAGFSVFLYLDRLSKGEIARLPAYDRCEELP